MFQLWVNLPMKQKKSDPFVKLVKKNDVPVLTLSAKSSLKVICGTVTTNTSELRYLSPASVVIEPLLSNSNIHTNCNSNSDTIQTVQSITGPATDIAGSPMNMLHASIGESNQALRFTTKAKNSVMIYVRKGSVFLPTSTTDVGGSVETSSEIRRGNVLYCTPPG